MDLDTCLTIMVERDASDLLLTVGSPPAFRIDGQVHPLRDSPLTPEDTQRLAAATMTERQRAEFAQTWEMNVALVRPPESRFRVNVFRQRGQVGLVIRRIKTKIASLDELRMPAVCKDIALSRSGLALVVGAAGSGKSTLLAAMVEHRSAHLSGHIVTIEDPIEFVHSHRLSLITQREVGLDTHSFSSALRNTLRQAPDVILIGEIRDLETMDAAITFAETGHLCLATLHSNNANQAIERILNFFPVARHPQTQLQLSLNLRAVISLRLVPSTDGHRVAAIETMTGTPRIRDLICRGEIATLKQAMEQSGQEGCQTFDASLARLYADGKITTEQALAHADSINDLRLRLSAHDRAQGTVGPAPQPFSLRP